MARPSPVAKPAAPKQKKRDPIAMGERDAAQNRAASHNYELLERIECGIALMGSEVKSIRAGRANLKDAYGLVKDGELWLLNLHIGSYENAGYSHHEPTRTRKLLAKADEIRKLIGKTQQRGMALVPTRMYLKKGKVKVELALARGKQLWDKRETERRKTAEREAREAIARARKS
jgi:SsrA-binding protein